MEDEENLFEVLIDSIYLLFDKFEICMDMSLSKLLSSFFSVNEKNFLKGTGHVLEDMKQKNMLELNYINLEKLILGYNIDIYKMDGWFCLDKVLRNLMCLFSLSMGLPTLGKKIKYWKC
jgi:hypothetical protein